MKPLLILLFLHLVCVGGVGYYYSSVMSNTVVYDPPVDKTTPEKGMKGEYYAATSATSTHYNIPWTILIYGIGGLVLLIIAAGLKLTKIIPN